MPSAPAFSAACANSFAIAVPYPHPATTGHAMVGLLHSGRNHRRELLQRQREELPRTSCRKEARWLVLQQPIEVLAIRPFIKRISCR